VCSCSSFSPISTVYPVHSVCAWNQAGRRACVDGGAADLTTYSLFLIPRRLRPSFRSQFSDTGRLTGLPCDQTLLKWRSKADKPRNKSNPGGPRRVLLVTRSPLLPVFRFQEQAFLTVAGPDGLRQRSFLQAIFSIALLSSAQALHVVGKSGRPLQRAIA